MASILVVEGALAVRQIVSFTLTRAGHEVTELPDAAMVPRLLDRRSFDLVLADANMPGMQGIERLYGVPVRRIVWPFDPEGLPDALKNACNRV